MANLKSIKAVAFDFHGTLVHWDEEAAIATIAEIIADQQLGADSRLLWKHFSGGFQGLRDSSYTRFGDAWVDIFENACDEIGLTGNGKAASSYFSMRLSEAVAYEETHPVLAALKPHFSLAVISNGDDDFVLGSLEGNGLDDYFGVVATAEQLRSFKPDPKIFHHVADKLGLSASQVLYVGDGPFDDVYGARRAGMPVVWLNRDGRPLPPEIPSPDFEVGALTELLGVLLPREADALER